MFLKVVMWWISKRASDSVFLDFHVHFGNWSEKMKLDFFPPWKPVDSSFSYTPNERLDHEM